MPAVRPRVLFLTSSAPQAPDDTTATFMMTMAQDVQALGYDVTILTPHVPQAKQQEIIDGVRFHRFRYAWPASLQTLCKGGSAMVNLRKNKLNALLLPCIVIAQAIALWRLLRKEHYDVIHSHWLLPQGLIGGLLARCYGIRHVTMAHGADVFGLKHPFFCWLKRCAMRRADAVIANSHYTQSVLKTLDFHPNMHVIPTGTTPMAADFVSPLKRDSFADTDTKLIVFLGRIVEEKGLRYAIESMQHLTTPARLLIIGDGVDKAVCESLAKELRLHEKLTFVGAVPYPHIYDYLSVCDAFVAPSVPMPGGWVEAQGNSIVEAMFAGLPVVASNIGGIPDAVIDGETGLLVPPRDPQAIANALDRLFTDDALRHRLVEKAGAHALAHFAREQTAHQMVALYTAKA